VDHGTVLYDLQHPAACGRRMSGWQPIATAPRNATDILAAVPNRAGCKGVLIVHFAEGGGEDQPRFGPGWFYWTGYGFAELSPPPTHWMPLPPIPEAVAARKE
jgi:hypothetical protein